MKENEAPEKIYLERVLYTDIVYDNWKPQKTISDDIEYTRTDAFIEKAVRFIKDNIELDKYNSPDEESYRMGCAVDYFETNMFVEDFKKYMKGE